MNGKDHARMRRVIDSNCALRRENKALRAKLAAVEYVTDQNAHMCSMCKEEVRAALAGEAAPPATTLEQGHTA